MGAPRPAVATATATPAAAVATAAATPAVATATPAAGVALARAAAVETPAVATATPAATVAAARAAAVATAATCTVVTAPARSEPALAVSAPRLLRGRLLLLDDHENLCGGPDAPAAVSGAVWEALIDALSLTAADNAVVGLSDFGAKNFMSALPMGHIQLVVGRGRDGADHALIDAVDPQHVAERFHSVVIASGDHIFADLAWRLRDLGLLVCNVTAGGARAARSLARACQCHTRLRIDLRDRNMLARLAAARPASHGFEGAWIARQVR